MKKHDPRQLQLFPPPFDKWNLKPLKLKKPKHNSIEKLIDKTTTTNNNNQNL